MTLRQIARALQLLTKWRVKFDELAAASARKDISKMSALLDELGKVRDETATFVDHQEDGDA